MFKCFSLALLALSLIASAQSPLTPESHFFGIPGLDSITTAWFGADTSFSDFGFKHPVDIEVLRLSVCDYRIVILDAGTPHFYQFRMDQQHAVAPHNIIRSCNDINDTTAIASSMCLMQHGTYFNPQTDRVAYCYFDGSKLITGNLNNHDLVKIALS